MSNETQKENEKGPFFYSNWAKYNIKETNEEAAEYELYSDVYLAGQLNEGLGPYQILNTLTYLPDGIVRPSAILRFEFCQKYEMPQMEKTDVKKYHGGNHAEELAALVSMFGGFRLRAGPQTRIFEKGGDPRGTPYRTEGPQVPIKARRDGKQPNVPNATGNHNINCADPLKDTMFLNHKEAAAFLKAARSYQEGLWLTELEPEKAWLFFVSAVETLAGYWRAGKETNVERLRLFKPKLEKLLVEKGGGKFVEEVADLIAPYMGATKTFIDFLIKHLPPAPKERPVEWGQVDWGCESMTKALKKIYDWRSRALHGGTPFPAPMCEQPPIPEGKYAEKPIYSAASSNFGTWVKDDLPMTLNTFEYIVRNALRNWFIEQTKSTK
ncbi:MAG: hypothetical protein KJ970_04905 [Candidatus Eisenbacteria bacterium]|uniref:Apea-like HEPN domain-containing protein n=1 Tax=Eiseniibacteriota bacterium TaxID=2212470 RepID=A0A948W2R1_UNCEI|nr:hypothetical protein [Candidatus Eisenbacteria bacterium]MBU2690247.1 hypothetical protein [Candidatus Eisenbacteria bacterium]